MRNLAVFAAASIPLAGPWLIDARARRLGAERVVDLSLRASGVDPDSFDGGVRNALIELTAARYADGVAGRAYHDAIRTTLPYLATTMASDIATVRARTLVVHGRDDPLVPLALAEAVSRQRPDWRIEVLECGHLPLFEAPGLLVEVVAGWLAEAPTRPEPTRPEPKTA
jgi:pimeloyl-ACP methyl ester carboxylesterase